MSSVFGIVAFGTSLACSSLYYAFYFALGNFNNDRLKYEVSVFPEFVLTPAFALLLLFSTAALAAYTPNQRIPFASALTKISMVALVFCVLIMRSLPVKSSLGRHPCMALIPVLAAIGAAIFLIVSVPRPPENQHSEIPDK